MRHLGQDGDADGPALRHAAGAAPAGFEQPWNAVLTGVGGTGVVTLTALVAMAAHLEGKAAQR